MKLIKLFVVLGALAALAVMIDPAVLASPTMSAIRNKLLCAQEEGDCVAAWGGTDIRTYSNGGTGETFSVEGSEGDVKLAGDFIISPQTSLTVTADSIITPTGSYMQLTSAGAVGATLGGCSTTNAGELYTLENTVNQTITITDTGNTVLAGNIALGQYDTLRVVCDGTRMVQIATSNN